MFMRTISAIILFVVFSTNSYAQNNYSIKGVIKNYDNDAPILLVDIQLVDKLSGKIYVTLSDNEGKYSIENVIQGKYDLIVQEFNYVTIEQSISIDKNTIHNFRLHHKVQELDEVIVTASESRELTSASIIDSTAMHYLQPTSFTDVLELLPGGKSIDPNMSEANLIKIREAGSSDMSSLGVGFLVDGVTIGSDANLQTSSVVGNDNSQRSTVSKGVDMRTISTDNIENIEIIRGIPSAEYGNLTSGLVIINRISSATPYRARFKADQYSKLFSAGKGISIGESDVLNLDLSYLDSKVDPRNSLENYKRVTASIRWNSEKKIEPGFMKWNISADYTGSFDDVKTDPDIVLRDDRYKSSYDNIRLSGSWKLNLNNSRIARSITANVSATQEISRIEQIRDIYLSKPTARPTIEGQGESDGIYLPGKYKAEQIVDGKPLYLNARIMSESIFRWGLSKHTVKLGLDWSLSKNFGKGDMYDTNRPMNTSSTIRPIDFSTIPSTQRASFFLEDRIFIVMGNHKLIAALGVRGTMAMNLSDKYSIKGRMFIDPRLNVMWKLPSVNDWNFNISGGIGWLSMMPTTSQLYPNDIYLDITQLNYFHEDPEHRIVNYMTYAWDNTNYDLKPARNRKWEFRLGVNKAGNNFSVTYFNETMKNGFSPTSYYRSFEYKKYDAGSIDASNLIGKPNLDDVSYTKEHRINSFNQNGNVANIFKKGIEFQFSSKRIESIKTRITVNGAWFHTTYSTEAPQYKEKNIILDNKQLEYIGLYQWESGNVYQQFYTNIVLDTYLERIGMIFSVSIQCQWFRSNRPLWNDGTPTHYIDKWGAVHDFTESDKTDLALQHLVNNYHDDYFDTTTTPFALDINLKATKKIGKHVTLSLFVNRLLSFYPDYYRGDSLIRRTSSPYFGMEASFNF